MNKVFYVRNDKGLPLACVAYSVKNHNDDVLIIGVAHSLWHRSKDKFDRELARSVASGRLRKVNEVADAKEVLGPTDDGPCVRRERAFVMVATRDGRSIREVVVETLLRESAVPAQVKKHLKRLYYSTNA
jgi:hypothetical protein